MCFISLPEVLPPHIPLLLPFPHGPPPPPPVTPRFCCCWCRWDGSRGPQEWRRERNSCQEGRVGEERAGGGKERGSPALLLLLPSSVLKSKKPFQVYYETVRPDRDRRAVSSRRRQPWRLCDLVPISISWQKWKGTGGQFRRVSAPGCAVQTATGDGSPCVLFPEPPVPSRKCFRTGRPWGQRASASIQRPLSRTLHSARGRIHSVDSRRNGGSRQSSASPEPPEVAE